MRRFNKIIIYFLLISVILISVSELNIEKAHLSSIAFAQYNREVIFEKYDIRIVSSIDTMTDKKSEYLVLMLDEPIFMAIFGHNSFEISIYSNYDYLNFSSDAKHLIRVGDSAPFNLHCLTRGRLTIFNKEEEESVISALIRGEEVKLRYFLARENQPDKQVDIIIQNVFLGYAYNKAATIFGWDTLGTSSELPLVKFNNYNPSEREVGVTVKWNPDLKLVNHLKQGYVSIMFAGWEGFGITTKGEWIYNGGQRYGTITSYNFKICDENGDIILEGKTPYTLYLEDMTAWDKVLFGDGRWPEGETVARKVWEAAPLGTIFIRDLFSSKTFDLYGFRELWQWGVDNYNFPILGDEVQEKKETAIRSDSSQLATDNSMPSQDIKPLNIVWEKTYGGDNYDGVNSIIQTTDGGYAVAGGTRSKGAGERDAWVIKLDSNGKLIWDKTYGGSNDDSANSIIQTTDGGYAVAGGTSSKGAGKRDAWIIKLDSLGNIVWDKTYGGDNYDGVNSIIQTTDGGYLVAGCISTKGEYEEYINNVWIIKIDNQGEIIWEQRYGRNRPSALVETTEIIQTADGGYAVVGYIYREVCAPTGESWIIKIDNQGNKIWDRTFTNTPNYAESIIQTIDGDLMVAGASFFKDIAESDTWLIKLDNYGNIVWEKTFGGDMSDGANSIIQTTDGGYAIAGYTYSKGAGYIDAWIIKLDEQGNLNQELEDLPTEMETEASAKLSPLQGSLHCPDKAGYACSSCLDEPGYVNHFQGFNVLTEEEDCYVSLVTSDGSSMGDINDCVVTITGEKWLGLEDEEGILLVDVLNKGNFDFVPAHKWSSKTMNFPRDGYQYQLAEGGKEFRLYLSRNLKESFKAVPWQNLSLELKNNKTGNIYTYQFSKGIFPRPYSWGNGVANYGQCIWWAAKRWTEEVGSNLFPFYPQRSNMGKVKPIDNTYTPQQYDVLINYDPDKAHKLGHYSFIEKVEDDLIYISQFNYIKPGEVYNHIERTWDSTAESLYYSNNTSDTNEFYFKYYYRK